MCVCSVANLYLTLCDSMDCSMPGPSVHGTSQARILEWVAIFFSRVSSQIRDWTYVSCIGSWILYHWSTREALCHNLPNIFISMGTFSSNLHWAFTSARWALGGIWTQGQMGFRAGPGVLWGPTQRGSKVYSDGSDPGWGRAEPSPEREVTGWKPNLLL